MKRKLFSFIILLLLLLCQTAAAQNLEKVAATQNGVLYIDKDEVHPMRDAHRQAVLLVQTEEQFTNAAYLKKLHNTAPELQQAAAAARILLFNNDGTQVAVMKTMFTDKNANIVYSIEGSTKFQPVKSSVIMQVYEKALAELERQKRVADMMRKKF